MMKHRIIAIVTSLVAWAVALCQNMAVTDFQKIPNDMDARVNYPVVDQNGKTCALIKVETINTGFNFSTGTLQVQKVDQQPGEVWVYVQPGVRKMTIRHQDLGVIRDYAFPCAIEAGTVYVLKLESATVQTIVTPQVKATGFLVVNSDPEGAQVWLNDEMMGMTPFSKMYNIGDRLDYRIRKDMYHDEVGKITIDKTQTQLNAKLQPAFGQISVTSTPSGASVYLDRSSQSMGTTPLTLREIASGKHSVMVQLPMYGTASADVMVNDGQTAPVALTLSAKFAEIKINSLPGAKIEVNGQQIGTGSATTRQGEGICNITASLPGHRDATKQINVVVGQDQEITLTPSPIYGTLIIESQPMGAKILVDNKEYGTTPNIVPELLVGTHKVTLRKDGYVELSRNIDITDAQENKLNLELTKEQPKTTASTTPSTSSQSTTNAYKPYDLLYQIQYTDKNSIMEPTKAEFANTHRNGDEINAFGDRLYASDIEYLMPKLYFKTLKKTEEQMPYRVKIVKPNGTVSRNSSTSPAGFTIEGTLSISPRDNETWYKLKSWGNENGTAYSPGVYIWEFWDDNKRLYSTPVKLYAKKGEVPVQVTEVKFSNVDYDGNTLTDFDKPLKASEIQYLLPRIYVLSLVDEDRPTEFKHKIFNPDGTLKASANSPEGFTSKREITVHPNSTWIQLLSWGSKTPGSVYKPGTYTYEVWWGDQLLYRTPITFE